MARFSEKSMRNAHALVRDLIGRMIREKLSRSEVRTEESQISSDLSWTSLPWAYQARLHGLIDGAMIALETSGQIVWSHRLGGAWVPSGEFLAKGGNYSLLPVDGSGSAFVWAGTDKIWM